jgi:hypothetical protein
MLSEIVSEQLLSLIVAAGMDKRAGQNGSCDCCSTLAVAGPLGGRFGLGLPYVQQPQVRSRFRGLMRRAELT